MHLHLSVKHAFQGRFEDEPDEAVEVIERLGIQSMFAAAVALCLLK